MHMNIHNKATTLLRTVAVTSTVHSRHDDCKRSPLQTDVVALEGSKPRLLEKCCPCRFRSRLQKNHYLALHLKFRNMDDLDQLLEDQQTPRQCSLPAVSYT